MGKFSLPMLFRVVLDNKLKFEMHICNISALIAHKTGLICKCLNALVNDDASVGFFFVLSTLVKGCKIVKYNIFLILRIII